MAFIIEQNLVEPWKLELIDALMRPQQQQQHTGRSYCAIMARKSAILSAFKWIPMLADCISISVRHVVQRTLEVYSSRVVYYRLPSRLVVEPTHY